MTNSVGQGQNIQVPNYSGVNIQIFNPAAVGPGGVLPYSNVNAPTYTTGSSSPCCYPPNYYTQNFNDKKTEKRQIVQLTDDYIRNLERYLNDQNKNVRLMGAKEVIARLQEDESRKGDPALNALVNKMLQDPYQPVKFMAMAALDTRAAKGNMTTARLLQQVQRQKTAYGEDSLKASDILLKMSGNTIEKEFEVKNKPESKENKKV